MVQGKNEAPYDKTERLKHQQLTAFMEKVREVLENNEKIADAVNIKILSESERYSFEHEITHFQTKKERLYRFGIVLWCVNIVAGLLACVIEEWITEIAMIVVWVILLVIMGSYITGCKMWVRRRTDAIIGHFASDTEKEKNGTVMKNLAADSHHVEKKKTSDSDSSDYNRY